VTSSMVERDKHEYTSMLVKCEKQVGSEFIQPDE
jgi:hypothetical protein